MMIYIDGKEGKESLKIYLLPVPPNAYQLNFDYEYIYDCIICWEPFCKLSYGEESILICGHRFHAGCLRDYEEVREDIRKSCPICRKRYDQVYRYKYAIKAPPAVREETPSEAEGILLATKED